MSKKRDAYWDSRVPNLWLRNNVFYYRVELPRVDNKRRYKRLSLHTGNFYEAREKVRDMNSPDLTFNRLRQLFNGLIFVADNGAEGSLTMVTTLPGKKRLSKRNKYDDISELYFSYIIETQKEVSALRAENRALLNEIQKIMPAIQEFIKTTTVSSIKTPPPTRTISEVLESMLLKDNNCSAEQNNKRNKITNLLRDVGLTLNDDYSKFHNSTVIENIARNIVSADLKGDMKRRLIRYIKYLATCGSNIDPDHYKANVIANLPKVEKTKRAEKKPYSAYTKSQLLEIFNPRYDYFKENPDTFFVCLIALFTGARANGAITLQYNDIMVKDGLHSIQFIENHPLKQLKNEASQRIVPIHSQLLDLGFVDYVRRNEKRLNAKGTDFIFPKCETKNGKYNNKYTVRSVLEFFKSIGVKTGSNDGLTFHSFRKNASLALQDAGIISSYINDIIGWEGKSIMEQAYSPHSFSEIKAEMEKFSYDFLAPHFAEWKKIMADK